MLDLHVGLLSVTPANKCKGSEARNFHLDAISMQLLNAVIILDQWDFPWDTSNVEVSVKTLVFILGPLMSHVFVLL